MSVQAITWVIDNSKQKGGAFVVLLMIANHAHSDGSGSYPSIETLARESRMTYRQVARIILRLEKSGELAVSRRAGPHWVHVYRVNMTESFPQDGQPVNDSSATTSVSYQQNCGVIHTPDKMSDDKCDRKDAFTPDIRGSQMSDKPKATVSQKMNRNTARSKPRAIPSHPEPQNLKRNIEQKIKRLGRERDVKAALNAGGGREKP